MKRTLATLVLGLATAGFVGCGQEASTTTETTTETPSGSTTVTSEKSVETSGEAPPVPGATPVAPGGEQLTPTQEHDEVGNSRWYILAFGVVVIAIACVLGDVVAALTIAYDILVLGVVVRAVRYRGYMGPAQDIPESAGTRRD